MNIFQKAAKLNLKFQTPFAMLTVSELYIIPLTKTGSNKVGGSLDEVAQAAHQAYIHASTGSFVTKGVVSQEISLRLEIAQAVIADRLADRKTAEDAIINAQNLEKIDSLIAQKEDKSLSKKSLEELAAMREDLINKST